MLSPEISKEIILYFLEKEKQSKKDISLSFNITLDNCENILEGKKELKIINLKHFQNKSKIAIGQLLIGQIMDEINSRHSKNKIEENIIKKIETFKKISKLLRNDI